MDRELYEKFMRGEYDPSDFEMRKRAKAWRERQLEAKNLHQQFKKAHNKYGNKTV